MEVILEAILTAQAVGEPLAVATLTAAQGSTPRRAGAKMVVLADGQCVGSVGTSTVEAEVRLAARQSMTDGKAVLLALPIYDDEAQDAECVGMVEIFVEPILPESSGA